MIVISLSVVGLPTLSYAEEDLDIESIEAELKKKETTPELKAEDKNFTESKQQPPLTFSELTNLAPFSEVTVIQKKYLPKTNRFQLNLGGNYLTNNPFYQSFGFTGRISFFFNEYFGLEVSYLKLNRSPKQVTQDLYDYHKVSTSSLVSSDSYTGGDLVFVPFYGKMTWMDNVIVPFDTYISLGAGSTQTSNGSSANTYHLGVGQTLAISKSSVFRWDLSANNYTTAVLPLTSNNSTTTAGATNQNFTDIYLGLGLSFLFPGAKYR